jgi:hypothetical protein
MFIRVDVYKLPAGIYVLTLILIISIHHLNFMRMLQKTIYVLLAFALLLLGGCRDSDDSSSLEPSQRILGKWKEIARWNDYNPKLTPSGTVSEFLPDGTYYGPLGFFLGRTDGEPTYYRIESDSLYLEKDEQYEYGYQIYRYTFTDNNQLFLDHIHGMIPYSTGTPTFHIFKRIK